MLLSNLSANTRGLPARRLLWVASAALLGSPVAARAQDPGQGDGGNPQAVMGQALAQAAAGLLNAQKQHPAPVVQVTTAATVDAKTKTTTLQLVNPVQDTVEVDLSVGNAPPKPMGKDSAAAAKALGAPVAADHSLASWVTGLPKHVTLAPGEKKELPVQLNVPAGQAAGEYAAWVVASTTRYQFSYGEPKQAGAVSFSDDGPRPQGGAKLVYRTN